MAKVSSNTIEQVRHLSDIVSVINGYIKLKRAGNLYKALCPFHKEKTPSFIVSPQRQTFHCFGCGKGGDVFKFIMEYEKVDFYEALKILAQRCGVELEFENKGTKENTSLKTRLYELHKEVAHFYHKNLLESPAASAARRYLKARRLSNAIKPFLIGFAPDSWDALIRWAQKSYPIELIEAAGLVISSNKGNDEDDRSSAFRSHYDRFRNRVMFPIFDEQGRIIGFSGRIMSQDDGATAKYINSPETLIFKKSRILYGLHSARRAIVEKKEAIIVEGQIDVIRCHLCGFNNAVASQGTAFTEEHCNILRRYTDSVLLVFDGDAAGENAAQKVGGIFLEAGLFVKIAVLPKGEDPDSLLLKPDGILLFQKLISEAKGIIDFCVEAFMKREGAMGEASVLRLARSMLELIASAQNDIQRSILIARLAQKLDIPESSLQKELRKLTGERKTRVLSDVKIEAEQKESPKNASSRQSYSVIEGNLITHVLTEPKKAFRYVKDHLPLEIIKCQDIRTLLKLIMRSVEENKEPIDLIRTHCAQTNNETLISIASAMMSSEKTIGSQVETFDELMQNIVIAKWSEYLKERRSEIDKKIQVLKSSDKNKGEDLKKLEEMRLQLSYDIARMKDWNNAQPIISMLQEELKSQSSVKNQ